MDGRKHTVLVADNDRMARERIVGAVLDADPTAVIVEAESGRQAMELMRELNRKGQGPDLSILDLYMWPGTGREAAELAHKLGLAARVVSSSEPLSSRAQNETTDKTAALECVKCWIAEVDRAAPKAPPPKKPRRKRRTLWWRALLSSPA